MDDLAFMIELHPFVRHLEDREHLTLEERAIVGLMRMSIEQSIENSRELHVWLAQLNPHHLSGPALIKWCKEISDYILPMSVRYPNG